MAYRIEQLKLPRKSFGWYRFCIYKDNRLIAYYWHDYKGDEHGIEFLDGTHESWPVGRTTDFLVGGGPQPLALTDKAIAYLNRIAESKSSA